VQRHGRRIALRCDPFLADELHAKQAARKSIIVMATYIFEDPGYVWAREQVVIVISSG